VTSQRAANSYCSRGISFPLLLALTVFGVAACAEPPPRIGRDLPSAFAEARPAFDKRVKEHFPIGSNEDSLLSELRQESFKIDSTNVSPDQHSAAATFTAHQIVCKSMWVIRWTSDRGKIAAIAGDYGASCL
jgi:hypothetical protein